jgi:hypothetical protein
MNEIKDYVGIYPSLYQEEDTKDGIQRTLTIFSLDAKWFSIKYLCEGACISDGEIDKAKIHNNFLKEIAKQEINDRLKNNFVTISGSAAAGVD